MPKVLVGSLVVVVWLLGGLFAHWIAPYDPVIPSGGSREPPSMRHWAGTDLLGRDILSRILHGTRVSVGIGISSVGIGLVGGLLMGLPAGYYGGRLDNLMMRIIDGMLAFPGMLLALVLIAALGPGILNVIIAVGISSIPTYARLVRGNTLIIRAEDYVLAAKALGCSDVRVMARHVIPNLLSLVIVIGTLQIGNAILVGAALSYLGLGVQPPTPEWGLMTADGRAYMGSAWWISTFPGLAIFLVTVGTNLLGDGLRSMLDPREKFR